MECHILVGAVNFALAFVELVLEWMALRLDVLSMLSLDPVVVIRYHIVQGD